MAETTERPCKRCGNPTNQKDDVCVICRTPGLGPPKAEQSNPPGPPLPKGGIGRVLDGALSALKHMGYAEAEAREALDKAKAEGCESLDTLTRRAQEILSNPPRSPLKPRGDGGGEGGKESMANKAKFPCTKCDRKFKAEGYLRRHMAMVHGDKKARQAQPEWNQECDDALKGLQVMGYKKREGKAAVEAALDAGHRDAEALVKQALKHLGGKPCEAAKSHSVPKNPKKARKKTRQRGAHKPGRNGGRPRQGKKAGRKKKAAKKASRTGLSELARKHGGGAREQNVVMFQVMVPDSLHDRLVRMGEPMDMEVNEVVERILKKAVVA